MSARDRVRAFIDVWPLPGSHPDDIHSVWTRNEDEPRRLRKSDLETLLTDRPASNTERPVWVEALKALSREWRARGDAKHADQMDGVREQIVDVLEAGDRTRKDES